MQFFLQFIQKLIVNICDQCKIFLTITLHELTDHNFKRVLWYKTTDDKVIILFFQSFFFIPAHKLFIIVSQLAKCQICTISNKRSFRISTFNTFTVITFMDIFFDIHRVADSQVTIFNHHLFGNLPIFPDRCRPFCPHPLMTIWI